LRRAHHSWGSPELVRHISRADGEFESIRVTPSIIDNGDMFYKTVLLGIIYRNSQLFTDYPSCFMVAANLLELPVFQKGSNMDNEVTLEISPAMRLEENQSLGWIMDLCLRCRGKSREETHQKFANVLSALAGLL